MNIEIIEDVILIENTLSPSEMEYLKIFCKNFINDTEIGININFYNRQKIKDNNLADYKEKLIKILKEYDKNKEYKITNTWVNRVDKDQPKIKRDNDFHLDASNFTIITFINDDYTGGQFLYLNNKNEEISIKPKKNLTIILDGSKMQHKVCEVLNGVRFTLVSFLEYEVKKNKTLI